MPSVAVAGGEGQSALAAVAYRQVEVDDAVAAYGICRNERRRRCRGCVSGSVPLVAVAGRNDFIARRAVEYGKE